MSALIQTRVVVLNVLAGVCVFGASWVPDCKGSARQLGDRAHFLVCHDSDNKGPVWVAYVLTPEKVDGQAERPGVFRADAEFVRGYSTNQDYKLSGFDRGHLAPSADFAWSEEAIRSTYLLSNVVPQYPALNRGRWAQLERAVRNHAREADSVMVVSGVLFASGQRLTIGPNRVAVPSFLFKVFLVVKNGRKYAYGAIIPNDPVVTEPLDTFQRSIDEIEERTGLDFFSHLDDAEEEALESCMPSGMNAMRPAPPE